MSDSKIFVTHRPNRNSIQPEGNVIPIVLAVNQKYIPILHVCVQSILDHIGRRVRYCLYIFHTDITATSQEEFQQHFARDNVEISFINVEERVARHTLQAKEHITTETFYRFLIPDILKDYPKVVYLDCDVIVCRDIAELYHTQMDSTLVAAVVDADFAGQCSREDSEMLKYCREVLGLEDPYQYFQAGILVMNVQEMKKQLSVEKLFEMADTGIYKYSDQDILNITCKGRVTYLDMSWNLLTDCNHFRRDQVICHAPRPIREAYEKAREHPYIIHYAGFMKPWMDPNEDYAEVFWQVARKTVYYEALLWDMLKPDLYGHNASGQAGEGKKDGIILGIARRIMRHFFPKEGRARQWAIRVYFRLKNRQKC